MGFAGGFRIFFFFLCSDRAGAGFIHELCAVFHGAIGADEDVLGDVAAALFRTGVVLLFRKLFEAFRFFFEVFLFNLATQRQRRFDVHVAFDLVWRHEEAGAVGAEHGRARVHDVGIRIIAALLDDALCVTTNIVAAWCEH